MYASFGFNEETSSGTWPFWVGLGIGLALILSLVHYRHNYLVPHTDYFNVIAVINYLREPSLFNQNLLNVIHTRSHMVTAPVYYLCLTYPLSFVLSARWVLLFLGACLTLGCAFFAGETWADPTDGIVAFLLVVMLIHFHVTPLEGNRRSFTAFFLLGVLWLGRDPDYLSSLSLTALSAGIYPPATIIILTYLGFLEGRHWLFDKRTLSRSLLRLAGLVCVFLLVVSPFLVNLAVSTGELYSEMVPGFEYQLSSVSGVMTTFLFGEGLADRGAFFRAPIQQRIFLGLAVILCIELLLLRKQFNYKSRYLLLAGAGILAWGLAHAVHPLLYQPVKYTRVTVNLVLAIITLRNLPDSGSSIRLFFARNTIPRTLLYGFGAWVTCVLVILSTSILSFRALNRIADISVSGWKLFLGLSVFFVVSGIVPGFQKKWFRVLVGGLILCFSLVHPFSSGPRQFPGKKMNSEFRVDYLELGGLYEFLRSTPSGTRVAGPPFMMDPVLAFGQRDVYTTMFRNKFTLGCSRIRTFWRKYYANTRNELVQFLRSHSVDFLLVDHRVTARNVIVGLERCVDLEVRTANPVLNDDYRDAAWHNERFSLITPGEI